MDSSLSAACTSYLTRLSASKGKKGSIEDSKAHFPSKFALGPPWLFKGRALYQLHLVKSDVARAFIPKEFKLHEAFGYTLGGFFFAQYDDSPAAKFDELVVIAGIVRASPSSCAWAARVLVNNEETCRHGQQVFGIPSHVGIFSKSAKTIEKSTSKRSIFSRIFSTSPGSRIEHTTDVDISESNGSNMFSLCSIRVPHLGEPKLESDGKWMGPKIRISLPNLSGRTIHNPLLLKYSCEIECRVRVVPAVKVSVVNTKSCGNGDEPGLDVSMEDDDLNRTISVMLSKPLVALEFNFLRMSVNAPTVVPSHCTSNEV